MAKDPYEILGVSKDAGEDEIKRAYRKLAQKHHPDRHKGNRDEETKFKEINGAYEILSDKKKRQQYDSFGGSGFSEQGGAGFDFGNFSGFGENFADIFESFFGGGPSQRHQQSSLTGADMETEITISFKEAAFGAEKEIKVQRIATCESCNGIGAAQGSKIISCIACGGAGELRTVRNTIIGQVSSRRICDRCSGSGRIPEKACKGCGGRGVARIIEKIRFKIPAGIFDGSSIKISDKGDSGMRGGKSGDLFIHIHVSPDAQFSRKGDDVYSQQTVNVLQAILGDTVTIQTVRGEIKLKIPPGTQSGKLFRIKNHGIKHLKNDLIGDHFVSITVLIPEKLSGKERELYDELAREKGLKKNEGSGLLKKILGE